MTNYRVVKIKLNTTAESRQVLDSQSKICNYLYNHLLEIADKNKKLFIKSEGKNEEAGKLVYSKYGLRNLIPSLRKEIPFICDVYGAVLCTSAMRLSASIKLYQSNKKKNPKKAGWPKFRSWKKSWFSLKYDTKHGTGYKIIGRDLILSLGKRQRITLRLAQPLPVKRDKIRTLEIVRSRLDYHVVMVVEKNLPEQKPIEKIIALDPNHKNLAYGVDNSGLAIEITNLSAVKKLDKSIDRLKSLRDKCKRKSKRIDFTRGDGSAGHYWEPSRRWKKFDEALNREYDKRQKITKKYLETIANRLCRDYDVIAIGDYTPHGGGINKGMRRSMNNQSLIGRFKEVLNWTCKKSGKMFLEFDEAGTTRTCHNCGLIVDGGISPNIRSWTCEGCDMRHIRDENAAINGLQKIKKILPDTGQREPVSIRCTWHISPHGVVAKPASSGLQNRQDKLKCGRGSPQPC